MMQTERQEDKDTLLSAPLLLPSQRVNLSAAVEPGMLKINRTLRNESNMNKYVKII